MDGSAQCTSSKQSTTGWTRDTSSRSARISRFKRSCDPPAVSAARRVAEAWSPDAGMICAYQLGATARISRERLPSCSLCWRLSSTSSTGRYASLPARRSEQRPRPIRTASPRSPTIRTNVSINVVLPTPASAEMTSIRPRPRCARSYSWSSASISTSRPTTARVPAADLGVTVTDESATATLES